MRGVGARRVLTDLVSLVRHAVQMDDELVPYPELVRQRYQEWLAAQDRSIPCNEALPACGLA